MTQDDPTGEIINGVLVLNDTSQQLIGKYAYVFYSETKRKLKLIPRNKKDEKTFKVKNGTIDLTSIFNESFEKAMFNESFELTLNIKKAWSRVFAKSIKKPKDTLKSGKWLIFCDKYEKDFIWDKIQKATQNDELGFASKISNNDNNEKNVICVYTADADDEHDVMLVRASLRNLGITKKIPYKTNDATKRGEYASEGKKVSKYFC